MDSGPEASQTLSKQYIECTIQSFYFCFTVGYLNLRNVLSLLFRFRTFQRKQV